MAGLTIFVAPTTKHSIIFVLDANPFSLSKVFVLLIFLYEQSNDLALPAEGLAGHCIQGIISLWAVTARADDLCSDGQMHVIHGVFYCASSTNLKEPRDY